MRHVPGMMAYLQSLLAHGAMSVLEQVSVLACGLLRSSRFTRMLEMAQTGDIDIPFKVSYAAYA